VNGKHSYLDQDVNGKPSL